MFVWRTYKVVNYGMVTKEVKMFLILGILPIFISINGK